MQQVNWSIERATEIFNKPFNDLLYYAHTIFKENFEHNTIQISTLLSIKTGGCPENCSYCAQSAHYQTGLEKKSLMNIEEVMAAAKKAKDAGATRFCMGAAWRGLHNKDLAAVIAMIKEVKALGLETCATFGLLDEVQAKKLNEAGLDFYNHNIDTSKEFYDQIITTRTFDDRIQTLNYIREAGIKVCCGGIIGMGESNSDRISMLCTLANMQEPPESVPINLLGRVEGTPLENAAIPDSIDFVRTIALARIMMPKSYVRLSAGRENMSDELQALCFFAGANSIFYGERLLTINNSAPDQDEVLFKKLGLKKHE